MPLAVCNLSQLTKLDLSSNSLRGLPDEIGNLRSLEVLDLRSNEVTQLPPEIGNLIELRTLYIGENQLVQLPKELADLKKLTIIELEPNPAADDLREWVEGHLRALVLPSRHPIFEVPGPPWYKKMRIDDDYMGYT